MTYLFIGENRSKRAVEMGVTWEDGHLAAKTLFDALEYAKIDPREQVFVNLFRQNGKVNRLVLMDLATAAEVGVELVGMGRKVQTVLEQHKIKHIKLVHPAARGTIRKTTNYRAHVKKQLKGA